VCPILEFGATCWDPCREGQINALHRVLPKAAEVADYTNYSDWETFAQPRTIARLRSLFKAYCWERAWKAIGDRLRRVFCFSRVDHVRNLGTGSKEGISGIIHL
jgi:hypothetical protein